MGPVSAVPIWYANHQGYWTWALDQRDQFADIGTNVFDGGRFAIKKITRWLCQSRRLDARAKNNKMNRALGGILGFDESETRHDMRSHQREHMTAR